MGSVYVISYQHTLDGQLKQNKPSQNQQYPVHDLSHRIFRHPKWHETKATKRIFDTGILMPVTIYLRPKHAALLGFLFRSPPSRRSGCHDLRDRYIHFNRGNGLASESPDSFHGRI